MKNDVINSWFWDVVIIAFSLWTFISGVIGGLKTGRTSSWRMHARRDKDPVLFYFQILLLAVICLVCFYFGVMALWGKLNGD